MIISYFPTRLISMLFPKLDDKHYLPMSIYLSSFLTLLIILILSGTDVFILGQSRCLFKMIFGIPCAACGICRGLYFLLHGDILQSFRYNPGAILFFLSLNLQLILQPIVIHNVISLRLMMEINKRVTNCIILVLFLVWSIRILIPNTIFINI
jgi:hypothetical protein